MESVLRVQAFRSRQGRRELYQVRMTNREIADFFDFRFDEEHFEKESSQRPLQERHAQKIAEYVLSERDEFVLGSLVYAVEQSPAFDDRGDGVGELVLDRADVYWSIDGQHRHRGLQIALAEDAALADEVTSVLIYVEPNLDSRKQMFADMNGKAKRVTRNQNVYFDSRDVFSVAARKLALTPPLARHVEFQSASPRRGSQLWINLSALQEIVRTLQLGSAKSAKTGIDVDTAYRDAKEFIDVVHSSRGEIRDACSGTADIAQLRDESILVSSTTMRALAVAAFDRMGHDGASTFDGYSDRLAAIDFSPTNRLWVECGFIVEGKSTPQSRIQEMRQAAVEISALLAD